MKRTYLIGGISSFLVLTFLVGTAISRDLFIIPLGILAILIFVYLTAFFVTDLRRGLLIFIFTLPFERIPSIQAGGATIKLSQIVLIALIAAILMKHLGSKKFKLNLSPYIFPYLLFVISLLASFSNMHAVSRGLTVTVFMLFTSLALWVIPSLVHTKKDMVLVSRTLFFVTLLISVFGIYQFVGDSIGLPASLTGLRELYTKVVFGFPRVQSTELEPLYLANFLIIPLSLAITYIARKQSDISARTPLLVTLIAGLVLVLTLSRGGYVGMAASLVIIGLGSLGWILRPNIVFGSVATLVVLLVAISGFAHFSQLGQKSVDETVKHFTNIGQDASALHRFSTFDQAKEAYEQSPLTGVGIGNFGPWVAGYPSQLPKDGWAIVNNGPLEILAETGVVGAIATFLFLFILIVRSFMALFAAKDEFMRATIVGLLAALVGVLTQYQFFSSFYIMHVWALMGLMIAAQNIVLKPNQDTA